MREISFFVAGIPRPGGSKRVFPIRKAGALTGKFIVTDAAGQANKDWRASVAHEAQEAMRNSHDTYENPWTGPVELELYFKLPRPKGHMLPKARIAKGGGVTFVRENAPTHHTSRPDAGKLARSTTDACTSILWADDAQIVKETHTKSYGARPGVQITMREAT